MDIEVICHMAVSVDGKCTGDAFTGKNSDYFLKTYYDIDGADFSDAVVTFLGRKTLYDVVGLEKEIESVPEGSISREEDFIEPLKTEKPAPGRRWQCVVDPRGVMNWKLPVYESTDFPLYNGDRIVEIVTRKNVSDSFLAHLRKIGVPYIFAGDDTLNCTAAVKKVCEYLGVKKVILHGGPTLNGSFLKENLITSLSLVQVPTVSNNENDLPLFKSVNGEKLNLVNLNLTTSRSFEHGVNWFLYSIDKEGA